MNVAFLWFLQFMFWMILLMSSILLLYEGWNPLRVCRRCCCCFFPSFHIKINIKVLIIIIIIIKAIIMIIIIIIIIIIVTGKLLGIRMCLRKCLEAEETTSVSWYHLCVVHIAPMYSFEHASIQTTYAVMLVTWLPGLKSKLSLYKQLYFWVQARVPKGFPYF